MAREPATALLLGICTGAAKGLVATLKRIKVGSLEVMYKRLAGPCAMSVRRQPLHPAATSGANSEMAPAAVTRPILAGAPVNAVPSVNHRLPSEPLVIALGSLL